MSKLLLHPPHGTTSFTLNLGCGKAHEYDGKQGIDCEKCAEHIATLSPDDRVSMHLRGPAPVQGATPEEQAAYSAAYLRDRDRYSWRLIPDSGDPDSETDNPLAEENARLRAELDALRAEKEPAPAKSEQPATRRAAAKV